MTRKMMVGSLPLGGGAPVSVQSMTNTDTRNVPETLEQIKALAQAGCDIVRVSVYDEDCVKAVRALVDGSPVPLVADIHFNHKLAIGAIENGISKLRINPGNIGGEENVRRVADCAKAHHVPIRIGVNAGSLEKEIVARDGGATAKGLVDSALSHAAMLEKVHFDDIVLSLKSSDVRMTVEAYRLAAQKCDYALHVGVTEAGLPGQGNIKSAIGIGSLLLDGIGDTIRVSLTGSPLPEAQAGIDILRACGLRSGARFVSCPTCGRTRINVEKIARAVEGAFKNLEKDVTIAVMGCVVNGPGEARDADIALCGGDNCGALYVKGQFVRKLTGDLAEEFIAAVKEKIHEL
ncbi:MAG: flavodoxin-dependent (E)-4-hydroxy-3-methylbut-2-enyl-diphosphate synthase [Clostridia bacterium]|nr:flavodoxin-dependent (E)-4-hydroxy-3-methylbut-2-enyl-diphosphate synthase [Clostridia bacterium]